jgi:ankyrin repeat protein
MNEQKLTRSERAALARLTTAIFLGETEKALTLIVPGLPLDAVSDDHDQTPIIAAIETGNQPVFDALLAAGASPVAPNPMGETPLHAAASKARDLFVRALVARGAGQLANLAQGPQGVAVAAAQGGCVFSQRIDHKVPVTALRRAIRVPGARG